MLSTCYHVGMSLQYAGSGTRVTVAVARKMTRATRHRAVIMGLTL
jgi:hypothetical protein